MKLNCFLENLGLTVYSNNLSSKQPNRNNSDAN